MVQVSAEMAKVGGAKLLDMVRARCPFSEPQFGYLESRVFAEAVFKAMLEVSPKGRVPES